MQYWRDLCNAAYNCLIVLFITTQNKEGHFKTYIFETENLTQWINLIDCEQTDFNFEIETGF